MTFNQINLLLEIAIEETGQGYLLDNLMGVSRLEQVQGVLYNRELNHGEELLLVEIEMILSRHKEMEGLNQQFRTNEDIEL